MCWKQRVLIMMRPVLSLSGRWRYGAVVRASIRGRQGQDHRGDGFGAARFGRGLCVKVVQFLKARFRRGVMLDLGAEVVHFGWRQFLGYD